MAESSSIEWTDATWNPVTGCSVVSPGCTNCYAMRLAGGRLQHHSTRKGLTTPSKAGPVWNGQVRFNHDMLREPLRWRRPRRIFVCAHGDLFHESVPDAWIDQVFAVMAVAGDHTFQVLTKRAERLRAYVTARGRVHAICRWLPHFAEGRDPPAPDVRFSDAEIDQANSYMRWPLPNVWLGVSAEDQERADERLRYLLNTPATVRFVSAEPLLGPIDIARAFLPAMKDRIEQRLPSPTDGRGSLHWVIVGGESGPGARAMHPGWARSLRDQCVAAGIPFHFKQWGAWAPVCAIDNVDQFYHSAPLRDPEAIRRCKVSTDVLQIDGRHGDPFDFGPGAMMVMEIGKHAAGRRLDGVEHNGMPDA